ncbi:MAG TPA: cohesin domain-containing protein, partial [Bacillota bacterium]|nr:cohesin domain-containing protein [Bacillota bacterium]
MKSLKALLLFILVALLVWPVSTPIHAAGAVHVEARYEQASNQQAMLRMALVNDDTQALTNLSFRYFMDLTEVIKAGYSSSNVKLDMYYSSATATVSPIKVFDAAKNIYYYEVSFGTYSLAKGSRIEANFSIHLNSWQQVWNSANDHSFTGLTNSMATTQYIPVYQSGTIIYGKEPSGYDTTPPAVPTGLKATAVSTSQINLDWADNTETDLAKYRIYAGTSSGSLNFVAETTTSSYNHMALIADTTYYYQITAVDASGNESTRTTVTSATTLKETAFTVSIGDNNGLPGQTLMVPIKFSSIPASGVSSCRFAIQYDSAVLEANRVSPGTIVIDSSEFSYNCKNDISPGEAIILFIDPTLQDYPVKTDGIFALVEFTIKAGAPAGNYRLRIEPTDASFTSIVGENIIGITNVSYSDGTIKVNDDTTPPATPTGLISTAVSASQINLDWADNNETDLAKYRIYAGTSSGSLSLVGETTTSTYNHTGLTSNTTYYYQVTAVDASGNESAKTTIASAKTLGNDITPPTTPTGLTATAVSTSQINLDWADNTETDLGKYRIYAGRGCR